MIVIENGYKLPDDGDDSTIWWDSVSFDIQRMATHNHDGVDSEILSVTTQSISSASWVLVSTANYRQLVTMPTGFTYDNVAIEMRLATGDIINPTIEKVSASSYYVYTNDNTLDLTAVYSS